MRTYRSQIKNVRRPRLGRVQVNRPLTAKHLDDLYRGMKQAGNITCALHCHAADRAGMDVRP